MLHTTTTQAPMLGVTKEPSANGNPFNYQRASQSLMKRLYVKASKSAIPDNVADDIVCSTMADVLLNHVPYDVRMSNARFNREIGSVASEILREKIQQYLEQRKSQKQDVPTAEISGYGEPEINLGVVLAEDPLAIEAVHNYIGDDVPFADLVGDNDDMETFNTTFRIDPQFKTTRNTSAQSENSPKQGATNPYDFFKATIEEAIEKMPELDMGGFWERYNNPSLNSMDPFAGEYQIAQYVAQRTQGLTTEDVLDQQVFHDALSSVIYDTKVTPSLEHKGADYSRAQKRTSLQRQTKPRRGDGSLIAHSKLPTSIDYTKLKRYIRSCGISRRWASRIAQHIRKRKLPVSESMNLVQRVSSDPAFMQCFKNLYAVQFLNSGTG